MIDSEMHRLLTLIGALILLASCGGTSTPTPSPPESAVSPSASGTLARSRTPEDAVKAVLPSTGQGSTSPCRPPQQDPFKDPACPITPHLRQRLATVQMHADPICRCQNTPSSIPIHPAVVSEKGATVTVTFPFQPPYEVQFTVVKQGGGWLVDNASCGTPAKDIYQDPIGPC
jgi:hypothetical protein